MFNEKECSVSPLEDCMVDLYKPETVCSFFCIAIYFSEIVLTVYLFVFIWYLFPNLSYVYWLGFIISCTC